IAFQPTTHTRNERELGASRHAACTDHWVACADVVDGSCVEPLLADKQMCPVEDCRRAAVELPSSCPQVINYHGQVPQPRLVERAGTCAQRLCGLTCSDRRSTTAERRLRQPTRPYLSRTSRRCPAHVTVTACHSRFTCVAE